MKILKVMPSRVWKNKKTKATASIFGAVPWTSENEKNNWEIETTGWTWALSNGTTGLGRRPAKTEKEALEVMKSFNERVAK